MRLAIREPIRPNPMKPTLAMPILPCAVRMCIESGWASP